MGLLSHQREHGDGPRTELEIDISKWPEKEIGR